MAGAAGTRESCACAHCQSSCLHKPGWFLPGEAERVAAFLGLSLPELFASKLGVDWHEEEGDIPETFVLAPATTDMEAGTEYPGDPRGACVFYEGGRCTIHPVKPFECREALHGDADDVIVARHPVVAQAWAKQQGQIEMLLGREPQAAYFEGGLLGGLLRGWFD